MFNDLGIPGCLHRKSPKRRKETPAVQRILACRLMPGSVSNISKRRVLMRDGSACKGKEGKNSRRRSGLNTRLPLLCTTEFMKQRGIIKKHTEESAYSPRSPKTVF